MESVIADRRAAALIEDVIASADAATEDTLALDKLRIEARKWAAEIYVDAAIKAGAGGKKKDPIAVTINVDPDRAKESDQHRL